MRTEKGKNQTPILSGSKQDQNPGGMMQLLLFDIDGTLVDTGGAGSRAMTLAFHDICGVEDAFSSISMAGMTDPTILEEAVSMARESGRHVDCNFEDVYSSYLDHLQNELRSGANPYRVLPGVTETLDELHEDPDFLLGLATGNIAEGARVKLEHGNIYHYFKFGGYGSDHGNRTHVVKRAVKRGSEYAAPRDVTRAVVIGDTPRDIIHAREAGAEVVAVASGFHSREVPAEFNPDLILDSLEEGHALWEYLSRG